jgi:hypothetical protein
MCYRIQIHTLIGDLVDVIQSKPELPVQLPEAVLVVLPVPVEVHGPVLPTLDHRPTWVKHVRVSMWTYNQGPVSLRLGALFPSTFHTKLGSIFPPKRVSETGPRYRHRSLSLISNLLFLISRYITK